MINQGITTTGRLQRVRDSLDKKKGPQSTTMTPPPTTPAVSPGATQTLPNAGAETQFDANGNPSGVTKVDNPGAPTKTNTVDPNAPVGQAGTGGNGPDGSGPPPPPGSVFTPPPAPVPGIDAQEEAFIGDLFGGKYDIDAAAQHALNQQLFGDATGKALVNSRASRGRAGLGGGIGAAVEGDVRRKSAQAQQQADLGVDKDAADRAVKNRTGGVGLDIDLRNAGLDEQLVQTIMANLGQPATPTAPPPTAPPPGGTPGDGLGIYEQGSGEQGGGNTPWGDHAVEGMAGAKKMEGGAKPRALSAHERNGAKPVSSPPSNAQLIYSDGSGNYYEDPAEPGKLYVVTTKTMHGDY